MNSAGARRGFDAFLDGLGARLGQFHGADRPFGHLDESTAFERVDDVLAWLSPRRDGGQRRCLGVVVGGNPGVGRYLARIDRSIPFPGVVRERDVDLRPLQPGAADDLAHRDGVLVGVRAEGGLVQPNLREPRVEIRLALLGERRRALGVFVYVEIPLAFEFERRARRRLDGDSRGVSEFRYRLCLRGARGFQHRGLGLGES